MIWKENISGFYKREQLIVDKPFDKKYEFSVFNGNYDPSVPEFEISMQSTYMKRKKYASGYAG